MNQVRFVEFAPGKFVNMAMIEGVQVVNNTVKLFTGHDIPITFPCTRKQFIQKMKDCGCPVLEEVDDGERE